MTQEEFHHIHNQWMWECKAEYEEFLTQGEADDETKSS